MNEETSTTPAVDEQITGVVDEASTVQNSDSTETPAEDVVVVEDNIERGLSKADKDEMKSLFLAIQTKMVSLGVLDAPENTTETPAAEAAVERSDETSETGAADNVTLGDMVISRAAFDAINEFVATEVARAVEPLQEQIVEKDKEIAELESMPAGQVPGKVARQKFDDPQDAFAAQLAKMESPEDRLRFALDKLYNG